VGGLGPHTQSVSAVRRSSFVGLGVALALLTSVVGTVNASAGFPGLGPTVGCQASSGELAFGGTCVAVVGPSAPTQPAAWHHWVTQVPTAPPACIPYETTVWAAAVNGPTAVGGAFWTEEGQRVPVVYSTPLMDRGWNWEVSCGSPGTIRFLGIAAEPRRPSPCSPQTLAVGCLPGFDAASFLAHVEGQVPAETVQAKPATLGVVGVPVEADLVPAPAIQSAEINLGVPDLGDGDPGEILHVVWVVEATPEVVSWDWPDGTSSTEGDWIPQRYDSGGSIEAELTYRVTADGFWSDGVRVHSLPSEKVGTIRVTAQLGYSVQQIQAGLG